jgi:hypothetical protein
MTDTIDQFLARLNVMSVYQGTPYGRVMILLYPDQAKYRVAAERYKGYWALSDAFKCFFLETVELSNTHCRPQVAEPLSEHYGLMVPRLIHAFHYLCGAEHLASYGYPYPSLTILRNTFDSIVLTSAALQGLTDFYRIEGVTPGGSIDMKKIKKLRKDVEFAVREEMTGTKSCLAQTTIDDLKKMDELYDYEVHGARLSLTTAKDF